MLGRGLIAVGVTWLVSSQLAHAQVLTEDLEIKLVANVGAGWQTVALENTYDDAIVVCTYNLPSDSAPPATTRIQNIMPDSFELRIQQFENSSVVTASDVHCVIADEGPYDDGTLKYEARKVFSTGTSGLSVPGNWGNANNEDVSGDITQTYANPHVVGQVMTFNDPKASVFWNYDCDNRGNGAFFSGQPDGICVGKHIGQINGTRADEWLGYIVLEAGTGTVNDITFAAAVGPDTGAGVGNNPPYNYSVSGDFDVGILTQAGEDGGQGGWAILYGSDPLPSNQIAWAIEEEVVAGDKSRTHTSENVGYWVFDNNQTALLDAEKSVDVFSGSDIQYSIPGSDVIYTITATNTGSGPVDSNSIFLVDALPPEITFYNDDIDDGGPLTGIIDFDAGDSGLTFDDMTDLGFSNSATPPTDFSQCNFGAASGYDEDIKFVCFAPKGTMREGTITDSDFSISFRARIN
ncbi:MAG: hypothetical protein ABJO36_07035 [Litorimonas sp.]